MGQGEGYQIPQTLSPSHFQPTVGAGASLFLDLYSSSDQLPCPSDLQKERNRVSDLLKPDSRYLSVGEKDITVSPFALHQGFREESLVYTDLVMAGKRLVVRYQLVF